MRCVLSFASCGAQLICSRTGSIWTKYTLLAIPGSFAFTMCFLPLYAWVAPKLGFSLEYTEIVSRIWTSLIFWLTLLGIPVLLLTRDFAWKSCVDRLPCRSV